MFELQFFPLSNGSNIFMYKIIIIVYIATYLFKMFSILQVVRFRAHYSRCHPHHQMYPAEVGDELPAQMAEENEVRENGVV